MNRLCSICVRKGSKGVLNKNIRPLLGKPLFIHSLDQARLSGLFNCIVVNSDSKKILKLAMEWGVDHTIERPSEMAKDNSAKLPVIQQSFQKTEAISGINFDTIVDLDATSPLRNLEDLKGVVKMLEKNNKKANIITGTPSRRSPYFNMVELDENGKVHLSGLRERWREMLVNPETSLQKVLTVLDKVGQIVFVVDHSMHLKGTVTDHDVRSALIKGAKLETSVKYVMNTNPTTFSEGSDEEELWDIFYKSKLLHIPIIDLEGKIKNVRSMERIVRRQDAPICYDMNASIYAWWRDSLINARHIINPETLLYIMPEERSVDIDSELDFRWVEFLMKEKSN